MRILLVGIGEAFHIGAFFRRSLEEAGYQYSSIDEHRFLKGFYRSRTNCKAGYRRATEGRHTYSKVQND